MQKFHFTEGHMDVSMNDTNDVDAPPPYTAQVELVLPPPVVTGIYISSARIWVKSALLNGALPLAVVSDRTTDSEPVTPERYEPWPLNFWDWGEANVNIPLLLKNPGNRVQ